MLLCLCMCTYFRAQHLCSWRTTCRCQFLSFHHLDWTQVIRIDNKHPYPFLWPQDSLFRLPSSSQNWSMPASSTAYRQDPRTQFKTIRLKHLGLCVLRNAKENLWVLETQFSVNSSHCMMSPKRIKGSSFCSHKYLHNNGCAHPHPRQSKRSSEL